VLADATLEKTVTDAGFTLREIVRDESR